MTAISKLNSNLDTQWWAYQEAPEKTRIHAVEKPYRGLGWTNLPSALNIFYIPKDFIASVRDEIIANKLLDDEGSIENWMRIVETPFNLTSSILNIVREVCQYLVYLNILASRTVSPIVKPLKKIIPFTAIVMSGFEFGLEERSLRSALHMLTKLINVKKTDTDHLLSQRLRQFSREYVEITPEKSAAIDAFVRDKFPNLSPLEQRIQARKYKDRVNNVIERRLIRRVFERSAQEVRQQLPELIRELDENDSRLSPASRDRAFALLHDLKTQAEKKVLLHTFGVIAASLAIACAIAALFACPYVPLLILMITSTVFCCMRWGMKEGYMNSRGWHFEASNFVPDFVKKMYHNIFTRTVPHSIAHNS